MEQRSSICNKQVQPDTKKIFLVSNSHIDPVWLWDKYEGIDEVINTFRSACDRLDEYPDLKFSASSILFYKWTSKFAPDVFERIKAHVASGRWEITGGWLIEPDCNLPTSESFIKSAEISKSYVRDEFGVDVPVAYCPDSFGHAASLPKMLASTGFKYYIFQRPGYGEKDDLPGDLFYWEHEGSKILCYRLKYQYTQGRPTNFTRIDAAIADEDFVRDNIGCFFFGVGDHGGGPTIEEIEYLMGKQQTVSTRKLQFSTCLEFFKEAEKIKDIPVYSGDLHYHAVGCYSVNRNLKHSIRSAERALDYTGRVRAAAGYNDNELLEPLWEKTIFNQFHDIMPGSCSPDAAKQAVDEMGGVNDTCRDISYEALKQISSKIPAKCVQGEFRIFNSLDEPVTGPFKIESFMYYDAGALFKDASGKTIDIQEITPSVFCASKRGVFVDTIPARSVKAYYFDSEDIVPISFEQEYCYKNGGEVNQGDVAIKSPGQIINTKSREPFFSAPLKLGVIKDSSDTWSHGVRGFGEPEKFFEEVSSSVSSGNVASFLHSKQAYNMSEANLIFTAYRDLPYVDLDISINWREETSILKLVIEPEAGFESILVQGPGAAIRKYTDQAEEPLHGWLLAGELGIVQDGAFAFDRQGTKIGITLVRSNIYGYHHPSTFDPLGPLNHTDMGEHHFKLRFIKQAGLDAKYLDRMASEFIEPFYVLREGNVRPRD